MNFVDLPPPSQVEGLNLIRVCLLNVAHSNSFIILKQALSQDPNSLANLDQDLPNNMIHQVAIKSLPQEWLWCQTWCSDKEFAKAKVIDLCNNPQTKEAKLTAAQRIVPEWKDYDNEIKSLMSRIAERGSEPDEVEEVTEDVLEQVTEPAMVDEETGKHTEL